MARWLMTEPVQPSAIRHPPFAIRHPPSAIRHLTISGSVLSYKFLGIVA